jgi:hypothetical protein
MNIEAVRMIRAISTLNAPWRPFHFVVMAVLSAAMQLTVVAGEYDAVNRIDSDPLIESVGNTRNWTSGTYGESTGRWQQVPTLVRSLPVGGTLKEARFLVAGVGGIDAPDTSMPFLQVSDFERFDFSFQMWTEGDERPGNSFFGNALTGDVVLDLPAPGAPGFSFVKLPDTIPGVPLWEATIDLTPFNVTVEQGQEFAYSLFGARDEQMHGDGFFAIRRLAYSGPNDLHGFGFTSDFNTVLFADHARGIESGKPFNQFATALTLEIEGPDVIPTVTTRATYTGTSGGQFGQASNWDKGVTPLNNDTKFNAVVPDDTGVVNFVLPADSEITHLSLGSGNALTVSGGHRLTVTEEAVVPGDFNVDGANTIVRLSERTSIEQLGRLNVTGGAQVIAPFSQYRYPRRATLTRPSGPGITNRITPFRTSGPGSLLDLSGLQHIGGVLGTPGLLGMASELTIEALDGGIIDLSNLQTIETHNGGIDQCIVTLDATTGNIRLDSLTTLRMDEARMHGIFLKFGAGDLFLPSLVTAPQVSIEKQGGGVLQAPQLADFSFGLLRLSGAGARFNAPNIDDISGVSYIVRDGAYYSLPANPATPDGSHAYVAEFPVGGVNLYVPRKSPAFISAGHQSELDLDRLVQIDVTLGSTVLGVPFRRTSGEISAIEGGVIDLNGLETLNVTPGYSPVNVNVDAGGRLELGAPTVLGNVKFFIDGPTTKLVAGSLKLLGGHFPVLEDETKTRNGSSLLVKNRAMLQIRDELSFAHQLGDIASATLERFRNEINDNIVGLSFVDGGIDLNRGVVQFVGPGEGSLEVAGPSFTGFGLDGRPITPEDRAEFGIAQLVVGAPGEPKLVELVDNLDNGNRIGMQSEALYLWGFDGGLPAFAGDPLGDGQSAALVVHAGSTLRISDAIDVIVYAEDEGVSQGVSATGGFVHLNQLLVEAGTNRLPFGDGFIELIVPEIPGDFNRDGTTDAGDIDMLASAAHNDAENLLYDLNEDGMVTYSVGAPGSPDPSDSDVLIYDILQTRYGDADLNGQVFLSDLTKLATNYRQPGLFGWAHGNFNGSQEAGTTANPRVFLSDVTILATNWRYGVGSGAALESVPEPSSLLLALCWVFATLNRRVRH